jgi:hypothetical protein
MFRVVQVKPPAHGDRTWYGKFTVFIQNHPPPTGRQPISRLTQFLLLPKHERARFLQWA